jgi:hypothetical protein
MTKRKFFLLILLALLVFGYFKLFYKTWSEKVVPQNADRIVAIDVKRITNTVIWNVLTTPSQWKTGDIFSRKKKPLSWKDMVSIPDYIFVFHVKDQPGNVWYTVLPIEDEEDFQSGLQLYGFQKSNGNEYGNPKNGLRILKDGNNLLIAYGTMNRDSLFATVAKTLFSAHDFISKDRLKKLVNAESHVAATFEPNSLLEKTSLIAANFDKNSIQLKGTFFVRPAYTSQNSTFGYSSNSLFDLAFVQPPPALYALMSDSSKAKISTLLNFDLDSMLLRSNKSYQLNIKEIKSRTDSAISYSYDDDFNKVEKVVVNNVQEPAFQFSVVGDSTGRIFNYLQNAQKLEPTSAGDLFTPMPFVRSYASLNTRTFSITANNFTPVKDDEKAEAVFFMRLLFSRFPSGFLRFFPDNIRLQTDNFEKMEMRLFEKENAIDIEMTIEKKKNDRPLLHL